MANPPGNSPLKYHHSVIRKPSNVVNIEVLGSILSIWEDDCIERIENNQCKCLFCNIKFQVINDTKSLTHVIGTKYM